MAPTTAPNVFWTASPTFLAIRVPPSSSKAASSNSATGKNQPFAQAVRNHIQKTTEMQHWTLKRIYQLGFPCCGNRRHTHGLVQGPSPSPGPAGFLRSRNHRSPPHKHDSGAWCRWAGTLPHIYDISAAHRFFIFLNFFYHFAMMEHNVDTLVKFCF